MTKRYIRKSTKKIDLCQRCGGTLASPEILEITGKMICVSCCIRGYKFALASAYRELEAIKQKNN